MAEPTAVAESRELLPKDLMEFIEQKADRAIEILRSIIDEPEWSNQPNQAFGPNFVGGAGLGIGTGGLIGTPNTTWPTVTVWSDAASSQANNNIGMAAAQNMQNVTPPVMRGGVA